MSSTEELLREISRCPNVSCSLTHPNESHGCAPIVGYQQVQTLDDFQVPEPWTGYLDQAPILFLGSNPSISMDEAYPRGSWPDDLIRDFFIHRFDSSKQWIKDGKKSLRQDGEYGPATAFWSMVRHHAIGLLDSDTQPGIDYALTEVVHCKSKSEFGVTDAEEECGKRYLERVLRNSAAGVMVVLGKTAREMIDEHLHLRPHGSLYGPTDICGQQRLIAFLPHPNAHGERTIPKCLRPQEIRQLRMFLR